MKLSLKGYLRFLRRQHVNIQHAHAFFFAFVITMFVAISILYFDYGFFRTKYDKSIVILEEKIEEEQLESPGEAMGNFFKEAKDRISNIKDESKNFMSGKEEFSR